MTAIFILAGQALWVFVILALTGMCCGWIWDATQRERRAFRYRRAQRKAGLR